MQNQNTDREIAARKWRLLPVIALSPRGYAGAVLRDARSSLARTLRDRSALGAILLLVVPWVSLFFLRGNLDWLTSFGEMAAGVLLFWWMSRSGSTPLPAVKRPFVESLLAIGLVVLWVEWRTGICGKFLPFLPAEFNCFNNLNFEIIPKLVDCVVFPLLILMGAGYRFRALGVDVNLRASWIALPALIGCAAYGFYLHHDKPMSFVEGAVNYFIGAGLPEEFLFRALLLTRLEAWWRNSAWALMGASLIFGLSHLPIDFLVFTSRDWRETWITALTFQMGFGAAFCFAYQRTRNIWPLTVLHAMVDAL
jgi:membrane protease YdiL (CAAX protease family)